MTVVLDKPLKREIAIDEEHYTLTISPNGLKLVPKGRRNGVELQWKDLVSGQAALAVALNASLERVAGRGRRPGLPVQATEAPAESSADKRRGAASRPARTTSQRGRRRRA